MRRLDYIRGLGATALWISRLHRQPVDVHPMGTSPAITAIGRAASREVDCAPWRNTGGLPAAAQQLHCRKMFWCRNIVGRSHGRLFLPMARRWRR